jgi:1-acyl-sn-glycerol-3-phosphate acyltransferase
LFYWLMKSVVLGPVLRLLFRPWVEGEDNIPADGPAILASNHLSFSDSIFLPLMLDRKVIFLAKSDYFTKPGAKGRLTALFFKLADQLPIDRTGGRAGDAALRTGLRVLSRGDLLGIYPEGTRSPDGRLYRGKTGVARMALEGLVPVLPVAMVGTDKAQPIGRRIPKIVRIGIKIGEPLDFSRYEGMEGDRFILRSITDEIMYRLMELSDQEYVDIYAATMKERLAAAKKGKAPEPTTVRGQAPGLRVPTDAADESVPDEDTEDTEDDEMRVDGSGDGAAAPGDTGDTGDTGDREQQAAS